MSAAAAAPAEPDGLDIGRWGSCFVAVVALHAGLVAFLANRAAAPVTGAIDLPAVVIFDMAPPIAPAPQSAAEPPAEPEAPTPQATPEPEPMANAAAAEPEPVQPPPLEPNVAPAPPPLKAVVTLPAPPRPQPKLQPKLQPKPLQRSKSPEKVVEKALPKPVRAAVAPRRAEPQVRRVPAEPARAQRTASLPASASAGSLNPAASAASAASWRGQLVGYLQRNLRYPPGSRGGGVASVRFSMNRAGHVLSASLAASAGSAELDAAALALFRGGTLPSPPADVPGASFSFTIPIRFSAR